MTKNENDKNRVRSRKQKSGHYNRKVKQRKEIIAKSLKGSISNLFNAKIQKSQSSSQVEEASGEDMNEVHVEPNHGIFLFLLSLLFTIIVLYFPTYHNWLKVQYNLDLY
jgi:hypothetical protein